MIFIYILLVYGITNIVVQGSIFDGFKSFLEDKVIESNTRYIKVFLNRFITLINCPMCSGFWIGAIIGLLYGPFENWNIIFNGTFYSGTTWLIYCLTQFLGQGLTTERQINIQNNLSFEEEPEKEKDKNKKEILRG